MSYHKIRTTCRTWFRSPLHGLICSSCLHQFRKGWKWEILEEDTVSSTMPRDKCLPRLFSQLGHTVHLFMEPSDIEVQVLAWKLRGPAWLDEGELCFPAKERSVEDCDHVFSVVSRPMFEIKISGIWRSVNDFKNSRRHRSSSFFFLFEKKREISLIKKQVTIVNTEEPFWLKHQQPY